MFHRRPQALEQLPKTTASALARLGGIEGFARGMLVGVIPIAAYQALGSKSAVSLVYFAAAVLTMLVTLNLAILERLLRRRWLVTLGAGFLIVAALLLSQFEGMIFALGISLRASAASIFTVCLSLYVMDLIAKQELVHMESKRMMYNGFAWLISPVLGSTLWDMGYTSAPYLLAMIGALLMIMYFWRLRLGDDAILKPATSEVVTPFKAIPKFFSQRRLRIAYIVCISRSAFWVAVFVYGPIYTIEAGLPVWVGGAFLSGISALLFFAPVISAAAYRFGTRDIVVVGLCITGAGLLGLAALGEPQPLGIGFWLVAAIGGIIVDVLGNIPFMRSVRRRERAEMTVVFSTWREGSELCTPAIAGLVLLVAPFWVFYIILAMLVLSAAYMASKLPRRL